VAVAIPCPSPRELQRLVLGQVSGAQMQALEEQVAGCLPCSEALTRLAGEDALVDARRARAAVIEEADRGLVQDLIGRLKALPPTLSGAAETPTQAPAEGPAPQPHDFLAPARGPGEIGRHGPYRVLRVVGRGGMGVVFEAEDSVLRRKVALKVLLDSRYADPHYVARFQGEAAAVVRLRHPNIVQIYEVGNIRGRPYLALEFIEGGNLDAWLAGRPQPIRDSAALGEVLARAVHHMHQQGLVHRDLKPAKNLPPSRRSPRPPVRVGWRHAEGHSPLPGVVPAGRGGDAGRLLVVLPGAGDVPCAD
jgi:hypothetical protein